VVGVTAYVGVALFVSVIGGVVLAAGALWLALWGWSR